MKKWLTPYWPRIIESSATAAATGLITTLILGRGLLLAIACGALWFCGVMLIHRLLVCAISFIDWDSEEWRMR